MTNAPDDTALMNAYAHHADAQAFETLYARHHGALYRFIRRVLGPDQRAHTDEVFQDTWLKVVHARERWAPQGASFKTWLYTLAHHRVIDVWRRSGREVPLGLDEDDAPWRPNGAVAWQQWPRLQADQPPPEDRVFWRKAGEKLLDCLDQLPLSQRSAFLMHHDDGLSVNDVAAALDVGFETAKTRLRYALSKLRTCMGAYVSHDTQDWARGGST